MQLSMDACAYRLNRSLTLVPSGGLNAEEEQPCSPVSDACTGSGAGRGSSPTPTPFVAAGAVSRAVVSAFQGPPDNAAPLGSVFRSQEIIVESSSDETTCRNAGSSLPVAPQLSCTFSTPVEGSIGAAERAPSQAGFVRQASVCVGAQGSCPAHGVKAVCGKRNKMEDMYAVQPNFFDIPLSPTADDLRDKLPQHIAGQLEAADNSPTSSAPLSPGGAQAQTAAGDQSINSYGTASDAGTTCDTLHFFGVYDGHGGCQAAEHCAKRLHHHLSLALAAACGCLIQDGDQLLHMPEVDQSMVDWNSSLVQSVANFACQTLARQDSASLLPSSAAAAAQAGQQQHPHECARVHTQRRLSGKGSGDSDTSSSPDEHALYPLPENDAFDTDSSGGSSGSDRSDGVSVTGMLEEALKEAFVKTDAEFASDGCAAMVGSTALVALVGTRRLWLANCGDSRAVLCRNGKAIQLTDDHKPEREDEAERVEKAGGQVLFWNGHRVMGVLAMSRAIGDHGLRPYIIPEPEVSVVCRTDEDDFLLLASDGLWDVMANQEATNLCIRCIKRAREKGASRNAAVRIAASVLTKAAIDRGSKDNVTVVIVDLRNEKPSGGSGGGAAQPAAAEASSVGQAPACVDGDAPCLLRPPHDAERRPVELPAPPAAAEIDPAGGGCCLPASSCGCAGGSCSCGGRSGGSDGGGSRLAEAAGCVAAAARAVTAQGARASG